MNLLAKIRQKKAKRLLPPLRFHLSLGGNGLLLHTTYHIANNEKSHLQIASDQQSDPSSKSFWIQRFQAPFEQINLLLRKISALSQSDHHTISLVWCTHLFKALPQLGSLEIDSSLHEFQALWQGNHSQEPLNIPGLTPSITLRPYQADGVRWLHQMAKFGLNPILADDMGLGKTLQTLCSLAFAKGPSLVVCPSSVVANWKKEALRFFPKSKVLLYQGRKRQNLLWQIPKMDLVVVSHGLVRHDLENLQKQSWDHIIVDEAHVIKNASSQTAKALRSLPSKHRLALTGTPIQNHPDELWSLFAFLQPGYLGSRDDFRKQYRKGLFLEPERAADLKNRISPLLLRRLKKEVAKDLPPKIIQEEHVVLSDLQKKAYKDCILKSRGLDLLHKVNQEGLQKHQIEVFALLQKLRNVCNHPSLISAEGDSAKLNRLQELLEALYQGQHRVLLFCQSTKMLNLLETELAKWNLSANHLRLDGSTPQTKRQVLVDQFQNDPKHFLFLISTRAGGSGLNLTAADTVIFYDHDWNPAQDLQAQDRAYRIGQKNPVNVYKLICEGTLEEKVIARQKCKEAMAEGIVGEGDWNPSQWSPEDLQDLLQPKF